ncbi:hypothetical protein ACTWJ8_22535 [Streptomyces sp. SDT5-1]|uniref:hypothetical protein n=1 Tax=Streptomyces sp. SDT5-1 TaxID=3406418 RepID=UPI003FD05717
MIAPSMWGGGQQELARSDGFEHGLQAVDPINPTKQINDSGKVIKEEFQIPPAPL